MSIKLKYKPYDFEVESGAKTCDPKIAYTFKSKDGKVIANFFWEPGNVEVRGMIGEGEILHIEMPLMNPVGNPQKLPLASDVLAPIIRKLSKGEYE